MLYEVITKPLVQIRNQQIDNLLEVVLLQRTVEHDLVETIEKFRPEGLFQHLHHEISRAVSDASFVVDSLQNHVRTQVAGQNQDRVLV